MTILKKLQNYLNTRDYLKYRKKHCPKCNRLNWKYLFSPMISKKEKGTLEARICGNCGFKDPEGFFISGELKLNKNFKLKIEK